MRKPAEPCEIQRAQYFTLNRTPNIRGGDTLTLTALS